jgi:hypothetical protein
VFEPESDELKRKVFGANAVRIYNLPVPRRGDTRGSPGS